MNTFSTSATLTSPANATSGTAMATSTTWTFVCNVSDITPGTGVAALVGGAQVAVFRVRVIGAERLTERLFAVGNQDPFTGSNVMSRGITGDREGRPKVASPLLKQTFDLETGQCFEKPEVSLPTYPVRVADGRVEVQAG